MFLAVRNRGFDILRDTNEVIVNGTKTKLSPKEMGVLELLIERSGSTVSRTELLEQVWGDTQANDQGLTQAVSRLRQILSKSATVSIKTIPKKGYQLQKEPVTSRRIGLPTIRVNLNVVLIMFLLLLIVVLVFIKRIEVRVDKAPPNLEESSLSLPDN